jgi:hypothetical protein
MEIRFSSGMSSDRARSALAAEASSPSSHPLPRSSSQNQSVCFDFERSGSGMSLLSRLRGSKGYGACRDAPRRVRALREQFKSVFPVTCAAEKLPQPRATRGSRFDQTGHRPVR